MTQTIFVIKEAKENLVDYRYILYIKKKLKLIFILSSQSPKGTPFQLLRQCKYTKLPLHSFGPVGYLPLGENSTIFLLMTLNSLPSSQQYCNSRTGGEGGGGNTIPDNQTKLEITCSRDKGTMLWIRPFSDRQRLRFLSPPPMKK